MNKDAGQLHPATRHGLGIRAASRVSILLSRAEWWVEMIQGQDGDKTEARRLSRRVILGQKTTLGATDLLCHSYQRKPWA